MKKWKATLFFLLCSVQLFSDFTQKPWLGNFLEFHLLPSFTYRHYPSVDRATSPSHYSSDDRFTNVDLRVAFLPAWDLQMGVEFADTKKQSLGTQSAAMQVRYQFLDDISGDAVSFTSGLQIRWASGRSLKDVSCPYSSEWNFEILNSVGKEFANQKYWYCRTYAFLGVGGANHGRPWLHSALVASGSFKQKHELTLDVDGYFGFGKKREVNIQNFNGYGKIFHQSIDLGLLYRYAISEVWGSVSMKYSYRVFSKAFPSRASTLIFTYDFPFSIF